MLLNHEQGSYARGAPIRLEGSFVLTGSSTPPSVIRDGNSKSIASLTRVSAGLFTLTFDTGFPLPELPVAQRCDLASAAAVPALPISAKIVAGSYNRSTRTFQISVTAPTNATTVTPVASDGNAGDIVSFQFFGSTNSVGTDPA